MTTLALIGVGSWGKNYLNAIKKIPGARIKYICATTDRAFEQIPDKYEKLTNYKSLLNVNDLNGAIIATPNNTHFQIAKDFLNKGISVLVEKPLVEDYSLALKLSKIEKKSKAFIQIGYIYLYDPAYVKAKDMISSLGRIRYLNFEGTNATPIRENSSSIWDIGSHGISLCLDVSNKEIISVYASSISSIYPGTNNYDFANLTIKFADNSKAFIKSSWLFPIKRRELLVMGETDALIYDDQQETKGIYIKNVLIKENVHKRQYDSRYKILSYPKIAPLEAQLKAFVDTLNGKKENKSGMELGLNVTKVISLAEKSIKSNGVEIKF